MTSRKIKILSVIVSFSILFCALGSVAFILSSIEVEGSSDSSSGNSSGDDSFFEEEELERLDKDAIFLDSFSRGYVSNGEGDYLVAFYLPEGTLTENTVYRISWQIDENFESSGAHFREITENDTLYYCVNFDPAYSEYTDLGFRAMSTVKENMLVGNFSFTSGGPEDTFAFFPFMISDPPDGEAQEIYDKAIEYVTYLCIEKLVSTDEYDSMQHKRIYTLEDCSPALFGIDTDGDSIHDKFRLGLSIGESGSQYALQSGHSYYLSWVIDPVYEITGAYIPSVEINGVEMAAIRYGPLGNLDGKAIAFNLVLDPPWSFLFSNSSSVLGEPVYFFFFELSETTYQEAAEAMEVIMRCFKDFYVEDYDSVT